jgi:hypothetical protein
MLIVNALASGGSYELSKFVTHRHSRRGFLAVEALSYSCIEVLSKHNFQNGMLCFENPTYIPPK